MPLNETDKAWTREQIREAHKRHGWGRLTGAIKEWSGAGAAIAILIFAATQWSAYVEFRTKTSDRLDSIEKKLTAFELQSLAAKPQPAFDKSLPELGAVIKAARSDRISVPSQLVEDLRSKLLASNSSAPDFWPTLSEFVSYRSSVSIHPPFTVNAVPPHGSKWSASFKPLPNCTDSLPKPMEITAVISPKEAIHSRGLYENCRFTLDSPEQDRTLNAILKGNTPLITFKDCLIEYRGGEINLILAWDKEPLTWTIIGRGPEDPSKTLHVTVSGPAIQFENCLFVFDFQNVPPPNGQRLSTTLLAESTNSVSLPVSP